MSTFIGKIEAKLDDKGRVFVPAVYRRILSEQGDKRIILHRDLENECLVFYPEHVWNNKVSALQSVLDEWDNNDQLLLMQFVSDAEVLELDNQGRVLISRKTLDTISAGQDLLFVGMIDRFALWNPVNFAEHRLNQSDLAAQLKRRLQS